MAKKRPMTWLPNPIRPKKLPIKTGAQGRGRCQRSKKFVEKVIRPKFVQPPPRKLRFNYIIGVAARWIGGSLHFISTYACPG